jgi:hypothetical protein
MLLGGVNVSDIAADGKSVAVVCDNAAMPLIRDIVQTYEILLFCDVVTETAVNHPFNLVVSGTCDSAVMFCSTITMAIVRVVRFDEEGIIPQKIIITPAYAFVVVYRTESALAIMKHFLLVFTVNGERVHKVQTAVQITQWNCLDVLERI